MIWHIEAVAVNAWRGDIFPAHIDQSCQVRLVGARETILHRFWECLVAQRAWKWGEQIRNHLMPAGEGGEQETLNPTNRTEVQSSRCRRLSNIAACRRYGFTAPSASLNSNRPLSGILHIYVAN